MGLLQTELLPVFDDNYIFALIDLDSSTCLVVDPGEASAVLEFLSERKLQLKAILLTHHHADHIGGVEEILQRHAGVPVYAPVIDSKKMHFATTPVSEATTLRIGEFNFDIIELPGHTLGHIAYYETNRKWLFSGDVLFGLGCGRVFEGTYEEMYQSLKKLKNLPEESLIFCAHEYTEANLNFCKRLSLLDELPLIGGDEELEIYENQLRSRRSLDLPSVPLKLGFEKRVNPFLLADNVKVFSELRDLRNKA